MDKVQLRSRLFEGHILESSYLEKAIEESVKEVMML